MGRTTEVKGIPGWLVLMGLLTMTVPLGIDVYLPAFPDIAQQYQVAISEVERTMPVFLVGLALGQLFYGPVSDRYGRRGPLYMGVFLFALGSVLCAMAPSMATLMVGRIVQSLGCAACMVIPRAVIRDHYNTQAAARAMSLLMLITGAAPLLAPSLGGQILRFASWPAVFWAQALFGLALLVVMLRTLTESLPREARRPLGLMSSLRTYGQLLQHRQFMAMSCTGGLAMAGLFAYLTGSPRVFIDVFGLSAQWYGPIFGVNAVVMILASQANSRLLRRHHPAALLRVFLWAWLALGLLLVVPVISGHLSFAWLMVVIVVFMAGLGVINPNGTALALAFQGQRLGSASAMMGALQFLGGTLGGLAISAWRTEGALNLVAIMVICMVSTCLLGQQGLRLSHRLAEGSARNAGR